MTELDYTILAIIARDGPLSAYDVRKVFAQSLTPSWSSSTGTVYPSIARLEAGGNIATSHPQGSRSRKSLAITPAGSLALQGWIGDFSPQVAGATPDPVRTRLFFLVLVERDRREAVIQSAIDSTLLALTTAQERRRLRPHAPGQDLKYLASEGVLFELRARLDWLEWLQAQIAEDALQIARDAPPSLTD